MTQKEGKENCGNEFRGVYYLIFWNSEDKNWKKGLPPLIWNKSFKQICYQFVFFRISQYTPKPSICGFVINFVSHHFLLEYTIDPEPKHLRIKK